MVLRNLFCSFIGLAIIMMGCQQPKKSAIDLSKTDKQFIQPPLANANVPVTRYKLDAKKGDTIFHPSGSIIMFPSNAFTDGNGNLINGMVDITYREFKNPMDQYFSGIPMQYDDSGKRVQLESAGMFELLAYQNGERLLVNQERAPELLFASERTDPLYNTFYLDTVKKNWVDLGENKVLDLENKSGRGAANVSSLEAPIAPVKASSNATIINIVIDTASFQELKVYNNLQFELINAKGQFKPEDANEEWNDVILKKTSNKGIYQITFSKKGKTVSYAAKPVLAGDDYEQALKIFEQNNKKYQRDIAKRMELEKNLKLNNIRDSLSAVEMDIENEKIARLNKLIEARNLIIEKRNRDLEDKMEEIRRANLYRSFSINGFGVWNADRPLTEDFVPITAEFTDANGNPIIVNNLAVICKTRNTVFNFASNEIRFNTAEDNLIFGISNGQVAYFPLESFQELSKKGFSERQQFKMVLVKDYKEFHNYFYAIKSKA